MYSPGMPTTIRLPEDLEKRLDALARRTGRPKAFYIRAAITEHLSDLEDAYLADRVLTEVREGRMATYTLDEVERELGLED